MNQSLPELTGKARSAIEESVVELKSEKAFDGRIHAEYGRDIKLEADLFLHQALLKRLTQSTGIGCLSEEDKSSQRIEKRKPFWIIDPLDGSMNFSRGMPLYCVSVALWSSGEPTIGIVHDIPRNRMLWACDGKTLSPEGKVTIGNVAQMERAVLSSGFPLKSDLSNSSVNWFLRFAADFKKVRMLGSAALSLAWTAEGRLDAYFEHDIMLWDVAAGLALVKGAGGVYFLRKGRHPMSYDVLAANPILAGKIQKSIGW